MYKKIKESLVDELTPEPSRSQIRAKYLESVKPIPALLDDFSDKVLEEMTTVSSSFECRSQFGLFFRSHIAQIREEMYQEFKQHLDDTDFDLYLRKALMIYDGLKAS